MPKYLYLFRHAESLDKQFGEHDKSRDLSPTGMRNAVQIGSFLIQENIKPDVIYTSSAVRTQNSTQLIADAIKFNQDRIVVEDELYEASVRTFFEFVTRLDDGYSSVMCVGHNPSISYLAEYLTRAEIGDMVTAGLVIIKFNINTWREVGQGTGELVRYVYPALLLNN
jgi:phosphohistidine phosphatase